MLKSGFPKDFMWGASTAGHQVEGGNYDQWTLWEKKNAAHLAKTAQQRISHVPVWDEIRQQAETEDNYLSGKGVDHYNKYKEDFKFAKELNLNALRFSVEWSRIEPEPGRWDEKEIAHYLDYIKKMKAGGCEPVLNIWHWTHPVWFESLGGFKHRHNLMFFERFVEKVAEEFGKDVKYIILLNEPNVYASFGYLTKDTSSGVNWPPGEQNILSFLKVFSNLKTAHKRGYKIIKKNHPSVQVGSAIQLGNVQARDPHDLLDEISTKFIRYVWNWWYLNRISHYQDFVGFNYYFTSYYDGLLRLNNPKVPLNDLGWYMEPEGLYPILLRVWAHYKKPIMITESGVADAQDQYRRWWIEESIVAMQRAMSEGVKINGYFHWSLLDNFEWAMGWWPKFGLIEVDRKNGMKRKIRPSAKWFAKKISTLQSTK